MSKNTSKSLRNQVMYQIFVRNFSKEGTFRAVIPSLDRIKDLGVDIVWFAPIHPIGEKKRKGSLGSPYAIKDYRSINPEYGTIDDFKEAVKAIHDAVKGIKPRQLPKKESKYTFSGLEPFVFDKKSNNFIMVGERTNVTGSLKFAKLIEENKLE